MAELPVEGVLPDLDGATAWLNSAPLTPDGLRGRVVVVQFCTFSCVNWLRTVPYVKAWAGKYRDDGLVVIGVHSPEFPFEHDLGKVRSALDGMGIDYPIALDNAFAVWRAFDNAYWPALYFVDAEGRLRHHHFGEEEYVRSEQVIQQLLTEAGSAGVGDDLVSVQPDGVSLGADWSALDRRKPTSATPGPPVSHRRGASNPTVVGCTRNRACSGSTSGPCPVTGLCSSNSPR